MLVTAGGKEEGTSSNENNASLHTKAQQTDLLKSSSSISDLVANKHALFNLISKATLHGSLLLGRPWQFYENSVHHGRNNQYTLVHKDKNITLLPMTPDSILKDGINRSNKAKQEKNKSENQIMAKEFE